MQQPEVAAFFDETTFTVSYVVSDTATRQAVIIDPVLDFDIASGRTATHSADALITHVQQAGLTVTRILETHVHADHLSGAPHIRERMDAQVAIGAAVTTVQEAFKDIFDLRDLKADGSQFDHLFANGEHFSVGNIEAQVIATPGHTPACVTYVIGDAAFVGDTLFMPDFGTARTDFPGGSARQLYRSIQAILSLPDSTRLFMCHDYKAPGRDSFAWESSVLEQRETNIHINERVSEDAFVELREGRDAQLGMPKLILPSIQVNICAGALPQPNDNGIRYLNIPLNAI